ncbi:MAG TPA: lipocalin family protein [Chitinophagaceae bacterium]|nr:lipocalin family protein [Chitinophagaceae bacterium]
MKTNLFKISGILALALFIISSSCSKDDSKPAVSKAQMIARNWKQTDLLASQAGLPAVSIFDTFYQPCNKDDIWQFKADGTYIVVEGASKCNAADPDTVSSGTWQLTDSDTKIIIDDASEPAQTLNIVELSTTTFKLSGTETISGSVVTATIIFTAQ